MQTDTQVASHLQERPTIAAGAERHQVRTDDGVLIDYIAVGTGPTTLLFMHGWGGAGSGHSWAELFKYLELTGLRALVADLRGHGRSEQATFGFTTDRFARDMFAVADDATADKFVVVSYSMSGKTSQWMAVSAPERMLGQILISPVTAGELPLPAAAKEQWLQVARGGDSELWNELLRPFTREQLSAELVDSYFYDVSHTSQVTLEGTLDMMCTGSFVDRLASIRAATLVMAGKYDPLVPVEIQRQAIVAPIPGARLALVQCGHEITLEQPQEAAAIIHAFLAGLRC
jgi:pimeloyl-ACP methyl ester carboxylesterase